MSIRGTAEVMPPEWTVRRYFEELVRQRAQGGTRAPVRSPEQVVDELVGVRIHPVRRGRGARPAAHRGLPPRGRGRDAVRVGTSLRPGLHPHGIHGPVAAALAASLLAGLPPAVTAEALLLGASVPIAATLAVPVHGGTVRNVWTGLGAYYGAAAPGRAADGARGSAELVTRLLGSAVCTDLDPDELTGGLGRRWRLADSYLKPYACARWIHPALDAWRVAVADVPRPAHARGGIAEIAVETFAFAASLDAVDVSSDMHARFSLPTCLAALAVDGDLVARTFLPDRLARAEVRELAARVRLRERPEYSAALPGERPAAVTVRWRDGTSAAAEVRGARGNPDDPLSADEVERKFRLNVAGLLADATADAVVDGLLHPTDRETSALGRLAHE